MDKILVIDDEPKILNILSEFLKIKGYEVMTATSGQDGLKIFRETLPSLVIVDIIMPGVDGIEVLNEIKKSSPETEVIMITAYEDSDLAIKSLHFEASDFITKPINSEELYISLKRAKEKFYLKKQLREYTQNLEKLVADRTKRLLKLEKQAVMGDLMNGLVPSLRAPLSIITTRSEFLLLKLQEIKDKFLCITSYGSAEDAKEVAIKMEKNIQDIKIILENSRSITKVIESIIVRSVQNKNEKEEFIDVNQMIRQEIMFFDSHLYFKHRIEKKYNLTAGLDKVKMVYSDLLQIFDNLIKNAIEAMYDSSQKRLTINTLQDEKNIYIEFIDTGVGISRKFIENIFDPFFTTKKKSDEQSIDKTVEIGLGLPVCLTLIKKYGGDIEVNSQLGEGSTFRLRIPGFQTDK